MNGLTTTPAPHMMKFTTDFIKKDSPITTIIIGVSATIIILVAINKFDYINFTYNDVHMELKKNV